MPGNEVMGGSKTQFEGSRFIIWAGEPKVPLAPKEVEIVPIGDGSETEPDTFTDTHDDA